MYTEDEYAHQYREKGLDLDPPRPLRRPLEEPEPYPVEALGDFLSPAVATIEKKVQAPTAICAQSVLATASLATQAHANVYLPFGKEIPLSIYQVTIAESGERKTSADELALKSVREKEHELGAIFDHKRREYEVDKAIYSGELRGAKRASKSGSEDARVKLLAAKPEEPLLPFLVVSEPSYEGLVKVLQNGQPSMALFSSEGGRFFGGYAMNQENKLKTAAAFSELWDGAPISRIRSVDDSIRLVGRRVGMHLMLQPDIGASLLSDKVLLDQGLLSRVLVCFPASKIGTRRFEELSDTEESNLTLFQSRIAQFLSAELPIREGTQNELSPRVLPLSAGAKHVWQNFSSATEEMMKDGNKLHPIRGFSNKLPEHAARIAGVHSVFEDIHAEAVTEDSMLRGVELASFYASEALRIFNSGNTDPDLLLAETSLKWLREKWSERFISLPDLYSFGPNPIRDKKLASRVVSILEDHGYLLRIPDGAIVRGKRRRNAWEIIC